MRGELSKYVFRGDCRQWYLLGMRIRERRFGWVDTQLLRRENLAREAFAAVVNLDTAAIAVVFAH